MKRICVFCGSSPGIKPEYAKAARELGTLLAERSITLVYGGAKIGLMGAVADSVLKSGGQVIGVIPKLLVSQEVAHDGLTELRVVGSMHERKAMMAELSDGFIAMPGGFGTFEELCEILTWAQLGLHTKPIGLLNVAEYYDPLLALFDQGVKEKFIRHEYRDFVLSADEPSALFEKMRSYRAPALPKILHDQSET